MTRGQLWYIMRPAGSAAPYWTASCRPSAQPRIWITPPRYVVTTVDELAEAIAPYEVVPLPAEMIKVWLTE